MTIVSQQGDRYSPYLLLQRHRIFFPGGLTIDRWTWYRDNGNISAFFTNAHTPLYLIHNTILPPFRPQKKLISTPYKHNFSLLLTYIWIEAIVFLIQLIFCPPSPKSDRYSPYLLITAPRDFWRSNTECDYSIPTRRSLFLLSPITAPRNFFSRGVDY